MPEEEKSKKKKPYLKWIIISSVLVLGIISFFVSNIVTEKCSIGELREGSCVFFVQENQICEGTLEGTLCSVDAKGWIERIPTTFWFIIVGVLGAVITAILLIIYYRRPVVEIEEKEYKNYDPKEAKKYIEKYLLDEFDVPYTEVRDWKGNIIKLNYEKRTFNWYKKQQPFIKSNKEWFFQGQLEVNNTIYAGVYTVLCSLARPIDKYSTELSNGFFFYENDSFDYVTLNENNKPIYQLRDARERLYQRLVDAGREELALQLQEQEVERVSRTTPQPTTPEQQIQQPIPQYTQPYRRYHPYRRRY